jgi:hypothetical protein
MIPVEIVKLIFKYLELDVQWNLREQSQWKKNWYDLK